MLILNEQLSDPTRYNASTTREVANKIETLLNDKLFPLVQDSIFFIQKNKDAHFFTHQVFKRVKSLTPFKFNDSLFDELNYQNIMPGQNLVTLVAIFCSMVKLMDSFAYTDQRKDYLLWMQNKANIVDIQLFRNLVEECKQFDVAWLWSVKSRRNGPSTTTITDGKVQVLSNTRLQYESGQSHMIRGNTAVMIKADIVVEFLWHIFSTNNDRNTKQRVDMLQDDLMFQNFVLFRQHTNTATVFEQDGHPIEYVRAQSSYSSVGSESTIEVV